VIVEHSGKFNSVRDVQPEKQPGEFSAPPYVAVTLGKYRDERLLHPWNIVYSIESLGKETLVRDEHP
jgi:hypothetical protein